MIPAGFNEVRPYLGLRYYEESDAPLFYGRDEHVAELLGKVAQNRFVAILGSSGSGKSSLVRAGLLPELRSGMIPSAGSRWKVVEFKPGRAPLAELAQAIAGELGVANAQELVEEGPLGIAKAVAAAGLDKGANVLVIADQFEEVFRFQREEANADSTGVRGKQAAEQCQALARRLLDAAVQTEVPIYVLLAMRSDYLGECAQFPDLPERMSESLYLVPRLRRDQLQEAITAPVGGAIDPAVVQRLLGEVGSDSDQLPRLEHLLARMWDRAAGGWLAMKHYDWMGGWENGLEQHLEEVYSPLSEPQKTACAAVFQQLSELDRGRAVRRRASVSELNEVCGPEAEGVVKAFREAGFLSAVKDPVDITHECILREWHRLGKWLERENLKARRLRDLSQAALDAGYNVGATEQQASVGGLEGLTLQNLLDWRDKSKPTDQWARRYLPVEEYESAIGYLSWSEARDKQRKKSGRRLNMFFVGLIAALFVWAAVLAWQFYLQREEAQRQGKAADAQTKIAEMNAYDAHVAQQKTDESLKDLNKAQGELQKSLDQQKDLNLALRESKLPAYAAASQASDPMLALYVGWQAAHNKAQVPFGLENTLSAALANGASFNVLRGHTGPVTSISSSPDGKSLASAGSDGTLRLWDVATGILRSTCTAHKGAVTAVAWSPDGKLIASAGSDRQIVIWSDAGRQLRSWSTDFAITAIAWNPDSARLTAGVQRFLQREIYVWDVSSGKRLGDMGDPQTVISSLAWSPDGKTLAAGGHSMSSRLLLCSEHDCKAPNTTTSTDLKLIAWSPDGKTLATGGLSTPVRLMDVETATELRTLGNTAAYAIAWSPDGNQVAIADDSGKIHLCNKDNSVELRTLQGHNGRVTGLAWNREGVLSSSSVDGTLRLWRPLEGQALHSYRVPDLARITWHPAGKIFASADIEQMSLLDVDTGETLRKLPESAGFQPPAIFSPDGKTLAGGTSNGTIRLWDTSRGTVIHGWQAESSLAALAWSPDGFTLTSVGTSIALWKVPEGRLLRRVEVDPKSSPSSFSPDAKTLAVWHHGDKDHPKPGDDEIEVYDPATGRSLPSLHGHVGGVYEVVWSPDGKLLASIGSLDGTVRIWDVANAHAIQVINTTSSGLAWSPDGRQLASLGGEGIQVRSVPGGEVLRTLLHESLLSPAIAWSPDGKILEVKYGNGEVTLFPGSIDTLLNQVRDRIRLFTPTPQDCQRYFESPTCPPVRGL